VIDVAKEDEENVDRHGKRPPRVRHSMKKACAWQRLELDPFSMPSYPIMEAMQAPAFAMLAQKRKMLGVVRSFLNAKKEIPVMQMARRERQAPTRSILMRTSIWAEERDEISSQPGGTTMSDTLVLVLRYREVASMRIGMTLRGYRIRFCLVGDGCHGSKGSKGEMNGYGSLNAGTELPGEEARLVTAWQLSMSYSECRCSGSKRRGRQVT
jgi:hypothetical protein